MMKIKTQKALIILLLVLVITDMAYIYYETSTFNALYAGSSFILFGIPWDPLNKLQGYQPETS